MKKLFDYLKLVVFTTGVLVGIQLPGFVDQYGKNLTARVDESNRSMSQFQADADKYFAGDLNRLIGYYINKQDPVIIAGGKSIEAIIDRNRTLAIALEDFNQSMLNAYIQVFLKPMSDIRADVWANYSYGVLFDMPSISVGVGAGLCALIVLDLLGFLLSSVTRVIFGRGGTARKGV